VEIVGATTSGSAPFMNVLPDGNGLVYSELGSDGLNIIRAMNVETGAVTDVTPGTDPRYTATGHLVFQGADGVLLAAPFDVRASALTGPAVPVADGVVEPRLRGSQPGNFAVSRSGTLVYLPGAGESERLVLVDRAGREEPLEFEAESFIFPRFSPDGGRLAVGQGAGGGRDVWVFDVERGSRTRLTFGEGPVAVDAPIWSPQGDRLTFSEGPAPAFFLRRTAADGGGRTDTLLVRAARVVPTSWSPDGRVLAFYQTDDASTRPSGDQRDLWVLRPGGEPELVLGTPFNERGAKFSPDGRWLAYASDQSGQDEIYVRPYPGPGPVATVSTTGGTEPVWSPDGSELFYRTDEELMVVAVDGTDGFRVGRPRVLFSDTYKRNGQVAQYDVAPDGQRFLMVSTSGARGAFVLVQGFFEELKRLVPVD
jgi:serine/threonine-protein kinase